MAFAVTNQFTGQTTLSAANLDANFTDVVNLVNGGLTTANLSGSAAITNSQLATSNFSWTVTGQVSSTAWVAATAGNVLCHLAIPGTSGTYTVTAYSWAARDCGAQTGKFRLEWGWYQAGVWTNVTTVKSAVTMTSQTAVNDTAGGSQGTLAVSIAQDATNARWLAVVCDTADNTAASAVPSTIDVTVTIKHALI